jgi:hypothetical protein
MTKIQFYIYLKKISVDCCSSLGGTCNVTSAAVGCCLNLVCVSLAVASQGVCVNPGSCQPVGQKCALVNGFNCCPGFKCLKDCVNCSFGIQSSRKHLAVNCNRKSLFWPC